MHKLIGFLKPFKKECIIGPFFKLLEAILELLLPTLMALIINKGVNMQNTSYVLKMGGFMLLMSLLGFGSSMICQYNAAKASQGFGTQLRNTVFEHISNFSYTEIDKFGTPSLINRITNDINQLQLGVAMLIRLVIRAPFICIGAAVMAMILDLKLSFFLFASIPAFAIIVYFIITKASPLYRKYQKKLDKLGLVLRENLQGVRVIRAFAKVQHEENRFKEANDDLTDTAIDVSKISALLNPMTAFVVNAVTILVLWAGGHHINSGRLMQGEIIAYVNYITQILLALIVVSNLVIIFTKVAASANRINEILETTTSISNDEHVTNKTYSILSNKYEINKCEVNTIKVNTIEVNKIEVSKSEMSGTDIKSIEFRNVSFGYNSTGDLTLDKVSVIINKGETIGIIGGTGSGKSTFVNLIARFYDVSRGEILVNGINVKEYNLNELRDKIGIVPQKAVLFSGTIAENIRWGNPRATDEQVIQAAKIAQAHEFIKVLQEGYSTTVSRGGINFSGGQKQRLTIARAIASEPEILILDDSTSALDFATDAALRREIKKNSKNMTVLIVSQRVSSIKHADKIIVFDDGEVVGLGTHSDLIESCYVYKEICFSQISKEEAGL